MANLLRAVLLSLLLLSVSQLHAQSTNATFQLNDEKGVPVRFANIEIIQVPDSVNRFQQSTDSSGRAVFQLLQSRPYQVRISAVGHESLSIALTITRDNPVYTYMLVTESKAMTGVVVTASRPVIRQEDDKTIIDPEPLAATSTNAYEIMEKTPGLFVDPDGNIYLSSTTPATVYINGREQKMSAADVATLLKNLPPNAISSIEIMRTPSARYDASGSGGVVNVILRKGVRVGLTGSVNAGFNQGKYGNRFAGININQNNGGRSSYINLQVSNRNTQDRIETNRFFSSDSLLAQQSSTIYRNMSYFLGYGMGWTPGKKWEMNYDGRLSMNPSRNSSDNLSRILSVATGQPSLINNTHVTNDGSNISINQGLSGKMKLDSAGSEWTQDLSATFTPNNNDQVFSTGKGDIQNRLLFLSAQTNYLKKFQSGVSLETGLKSTQVIFKNTTSYSRKTNGSDVPDASRSGAFRYREQINAAFGQASKSFSGIVVKLGTRLEQTVMSGHQLLPRDTSFSINRTDLFPYIYISRTIMQIAGYDLRAYLVYRRTISRPAYEYLNPSTRFIDPYLYETGNPSLRPQFTQNYEANISVDERPLVAIGVNDTKDIFTQVVYSADSNRKISARTYDNLGKNKETYIRLLGAIPPGGKYFGVLMAQYNHNFYQGLYEGAPLSFRKGTWTFYTYHTLRVTPLTQVSFNAFMRVKGQQQFYELSNFGSVTLSLAQQFFKRKLSVTANVSDLFKTNYNDFTIDQGSVHASGTRRGDTRRFGLNIRYQFGIRKKEETNMFNVEPTDK